MQPKFCPSCNRAVDAYGTFCGECGTNLVMLTSPSVSVIENTMSWKRVALLSILSGSLYLMYWMYRTWKHYKDHTGQIAYPVWHALTFFVPIYSLFRAHAHMRVYKELMLARGLESSIKPMVAVGLLFVLQAFVYYEVFVDEPLFADPLFVVISVLVHVVIVATMLIPVQKSINHYWQTFRGSDEAPIGKGEVIFGFLGLLGWIFILVDLARAS